MPCSDPMADAIIKLHLKRLVSWDTSDERQALLAEMEQAIQQQMQQYSLSRQEFERTDRLTNFCDRVSFDFCFEQPIQGAVTLFPKKDSEEPIPVRYRIDAGEIQVDPWPFSVETYANYLIGYDLQGYPTQLNPVLITYRVARATQG